MTVAERDDARARIVDGAVRCVVERGATVSMADIAAAAGVSKSLLHYHYADRAHLLADVVRALVARQISRERAAMGDGDDRRVAPAAGNPVDLLWRWVERELSGGELRALLELRTLRDPLVYDAWREGATLRRARAARTAELLFSRLGLAPRMPVALLGDAITAFLDGLALDAESGRDARVGFDLFWLALLSLSE